MTSKIELGRLKRVDPHKAWTDEPRFFTPWLAKPENLALLGDALDIELESGSTEESVGDFRADIVCTEASSGATVLIENQLDQTNHGHIGQVLTYAAGSDAVTIVWIATKFRDEHRAALDWFNEKSDSSINFFGLEIELWKIGESPPAPKFNIVVQPNDWSRVINEPPHLTDQELERREFWSRVNERLAETGKVPQSKPGTTANLPYGSILNNQFQLRASFSTRKQQLQVALIIRKASSFEFAKLLEQEKEVIEGEVGSNLNWKFRESGKENIVSIELPNSDPEDRDQWDDHVEWLAKHLDLFLDAFWERARNLNAADYKPTEADAATTDDG